jgi:hypothetical protein
VNGHMGSEELARAEGNRRLPVADPEDDDSEYAKETWKWRRWSGSWSTLAAELSAHNQ